MPGHTYPHFRGYAIPLALMLSKLITGAPMMIRFHFSAPRWAMLRPPLALIDMLKRRFLLALPTFLPHFANTTRDRNTSTLWCYFASMLSHWPGIHARSWRSAFTFTLKISDGRWEMPARFDCRRDYYFESPMLEKGHFSDTESTTRCLWELIYLCWIVRLDISFHILL